MLIHLFCQSHFCVFLFWWDGAQSVSYLFLSLHEKSDNINHEKYHNCKRTYYHIRRLLSRLNEMKHTLRVSLVIAAVANVTCKHGLWLVASRKKTSR